MAGLINVTTKMFFDRVKVANAMERKENRCLSSAGAFGRTVMRRGMRRRKRISAPGEYPSAHAGQLKELIYFGFEPSTKSVVIGPTFFRKDREAIGATKTVPQLINEGGTVFRQRKVGRGANRRLVGGVVRQLYRPRPFVALTLPKTAAKLAQNMEKFDLQ